MNNLLSKIILIGLLTFSFNNVFSQTEADTIKQDQIVIIKMKNGNEYKGSILKEDSEIIILKMVNGEMNLIASNVRSIENYEGKFEFANPHDTRYFFGPSGIPIKKGKGYYQNILVTSNFVNYGITKNISIGGGFEFISTISGSPIWFLTPKAGFYISKNIHVGGGIIMAGFAASGTATLGYGVFTLGHAESNLSIAVGHGFMHGVFSKYPAIMISGTHRVSKSIALLTENYVFSGSSGAPVYFGINGIRILSKKNSFDIGVIVTPEIANYLPALPYVGYVRIF